MDLASARRARSLSVGRARQPPPSGGPGATPGAVVVGGDYQGLGIARSLGRHGVPVLVLDDERSIARWSRYVGQHRAVPDLRDPAAALEALRSVGRSLQPARWVLFPTREETVSVVAENREELDQLFRVTTPSSHAVRAAWDKRETYRVARQHDVSTPRSWVPGDRDGLSAVDLSGPVVVKPAIKEHFFYATGAKAWRADDRAGLEDAWERAAAIVDPAEIIVQEMVPGDGHRQLSYCALVRDGRPVVTMTARRLRQHPSDFGRASTYVRTERLPEIDEPSARWLEAVGYDGLVELEYKLDERDEVPKLLDVNARTWGYHTLGAAAGVDFAYLMYLDRTGRPAAPATAREDVSWLRWVTDLPNAVKDLRLGRLDVRDYLRSLGHVDAEAVVSLRDPMPALAEVLMLPYLAVRRGL